MISNSFIPSDRVAMVRENQILFKVREKSVNFESGQGIPKSLFKVCEKSGKFIFRLPQIRFFSCRQGNFVVKII